MKTAIAFEKGSIFDICVYILYNIENDKSKFMSYFNFKVLMYIYITIPVKSRPKYYVVTATNYISSRVLNYDCVHNEFTYSLKEIFFPCCPSSS